MCGSLSSSHGRARCIVKLRRRYKIALAGEFIIIIIFFYCWMDLAGLHASRQNTHSRTHVTFIAYSNRLNINFSYAKEMERKNSAVQWNGWERLFRSIDATSKIFTGWIGRYIRHSKHRCTDNLLNTTDNCVAMKCENEWSQERVKKMPKRRN